MLLTGVVTVFIRPIAKEGPQFIDKAPAYVAQAGKGPVGSLIKRYKLAEYVSRNQARLREAGSRLTTLALAVVRSVFATIVGLVTIPVLTCSMPQGPAGRKLAGRPARTPPRARPASSRRLLQGGGRLHDRQLKVSVIAGTLTYIVLWIMGAPYKGVVVLFVGFSDLIPLVGATLGAIVAVGVAALHSLPAAIVVLVFFIVYQQAENHLLQPVIMSRTGSNSTPWPCWSAS